jgi:hypothetical protein
MADRRGGSDTELMAVYDSRIDALRKMAQELRISMRQAAKRRTERAR